jgi:hypothetical protein
MSSFIHPTTCGYAKIAAFNASTLPNLKATLDENQRSFTMRNNMHRYDIYTRQFINTNTDFIIHYKFFLSKSKQIIKNVRYIGKNS